MGIHGKIMDVRMNTVPDTDHRSLLCPKFAEKVPSSTIFSDAYKAENKEGWAATRRMFLHWLASRPQQGCCAIEAEFQCLWNAGFMGCEWKTPSLICSDRSYRSSLQGGTTKTKWGRKYHITHLWSQKQIVPPVTKTSSGALLWGLTCGVLNTLVWEECTS